jgi:predicted nucleotidyltransferase
MGTTVWVDDQVRAELRGLQGTLGLGSVNATLRHLLERPPQDAHSLFATHREEIQAVLARHDLRGLVAFGSRARGDAHAASDLDLAAEPGPGADPMALLAAEADLEELLGIRVHLVELPNRGLHDVIEREGVPFAG